MPDSIRDSELFEITGFRCLSRTRSGIHRNDRFGVIQRSHENDSDGRIKKWAKIKETDKYLRVILLEDGITVHNAFFDRSYKEVANEN